MTQEEGKDLLVRDLCARIPYSTMCRFYDNCRVINSVPSPVYDGILNERCLDLFRNHVGFDIKPYLRPMSSMTEEESEEYRNIDNKSYSCPIDYAHIPASERIDWLNAHHFDYHGLIWKDLAIEVTEENNPYKE